MLQVSGRRGLVQDLGFAVLPYFAGTDVLPGSDFSLGCGRLVVLCDLRLVLEAVDDDFEVFVWQRDRVGVARRCPRWRSVVRVVVREIVAAAVF